MSFSEFVFPLLKGVRVTILLTMGSSCVGLMLMGVILAGLFCRYTLVRLAAKFYIFFFRGTPLLAQMYLIYYGSGQFHDLLDTIYLWPFLRQAWVCALIALALNTAAYMTEIARVAYQQYPRGEIEAAYVCGLSRWQTLRNIVIPRILGMVFPLYTNELIYQLQATSLVSMIAILDITGQARLLASRTFLFYQAFLSAALLYIVLVMIIVFTCRRIETWLNRYM